MRLSVNKEVIIGAGAIFAMFFGSGNIVLPLQLGQRLGGDWFLAFIGFVIAGVVIPCAGLIAGVLLNGNSEKFFAPINKHIAILFQFIVLSVNGPFGIVPRCSSVAFGGIKGMFPSIPECIFSGIFCAIICSLMLKQEKIMPIISRVLSPIKFFCLIFVVFLGLLAMPCNVCPESFSISSLVDGISYGYLTMDLCSSIFFATLIVNHLKNMRKNNGRIDNIISDGLKICFLSGVLLSVVYLGFFLLSVGYRDHIQGIGGADILPAIIGMALGRFSKFAICITVVIACVTTGVAYLSIWVMFIAKYFKKYNINYKSTVYFGGMVSYAISLLGFQNILNIMSPVVQLIYPVLILLAIYNIYTSYKHKNA